MWQWYDVFCINRLLGKHQEIKHNSQREYITIYLSGDGEKGGKKRGKEIIH